MMLRWIYIALSALIFAACSNDKVAGNSAETGSPELAGVLVLDNGSPASFARIHCVPQSFDALQNAELPAAFQTTADENGEYALDSIPAGTYSLEAFHEESGKRLLVQGLNVTEDNELNYDNILKDVGSAKLLVPGAFDEGTEGVATVYGTTLVRNIVVHGGSIQVPDLPADSMNLHVILDSGEVDFVLNVEPGDTTVVGDTLEFRFVSPLALPAGYDTLPDLSTDIPLAFRLNSANCDFDQIASLYGRWEATRISADGSRSRTLPVAPAIVDESAEQLVLWVRVDSLNVRDSVELVLNTAKNSGAARDVFPTNREYTAVWHFYGDLATINDDAEKSNFPGTAVQTFATEGVLGDGIAFNGTASYVTIENSAEADSSKPADFDVPFGESITFSLWVKLDDLTSRQTIFHKGNSQYNLVYAPDSGFVFSMYHEAEAAKTDSSGELASDTAGYRLFVATGDSLVKAGEWMFVAFNYRGNADAYINSKKVTTTAQKEPWAGKRDQGSNFEFGNFDGAVDEFFFGAGFRSEGWMLATYLNQTPNSTWPVLKFTTK